MEGGSSLQRLENCRPEAAGDCLQGESVCYDLKGYQAKRTMIFSIFTSTFF
jgi:hypothetical protein